MPKYAEVIFEPGSNSIVQFDSEEELKQFLSEHHSRAVAGLPGAPQDQSARMDLNPADFDVMPSVDRMKDRPAERVSKVLIYEEHPADSYSKTVSAETVKALIDGMTKDDGTIDDQQLVRALRDEVSPVYPLAQGKHESMWKADASSELDLSFLGGQTPSGGA